MDTCLLHLVNILEETYTLIILHFLFMVMLIFRKNKGKKQYSLQKFSSGVGQVHIAGWFWDLAGCPRLEWDPRMPQMAERKSETSFSRKPGQCSA